MRNILDALLARAGLLIALASATILGTALVFQYAFGIRPCALCIYQRWPYVAAIVLGAGAAAAARRPALARGLLALTVAALVMDGGIAIFHVGVEQHWWQGTAECTSSGLDQAGNREALRALLEKAPMVRCDEVAWSLFGISLTGYNIMAALGLALFGLVALRRRERRP